MNQNNNQIQKQQLSQEELQRTQVLNLKDVEETVRIEKLSSKKPAIIVAIIGVVCIAFGTSFGVVQSMNAKKAREEKIIQNRKKTNVVKTTKSNLNCTLQSLKEADGTGKILNYNFIFDQDKLISMTKTYSMIPTVIESPESKESVQKFITDLQPYLIDIPGYKLTVAPESTGGVITTTEVDLEILDLNAVPQINKDNFRFNVNYPLGTEKQKILTDLSGYTCQ